MKKTYQLKSNAIPGEQQVVDIVPTAGKAPVTLMAAPDARYELIDTSLKAAPDNIRVMRKGKHLHIFFDGDTAPGAVIENFYQVHTDNQPKLIGRTDQGALYEYIPESAAPSALVNQLADTGQNYGMALGGPELTGAAGAVAGLLPVVGLSPWLLGAGALGAAAVAGGGGGGGASAASTPSYVPNGGKAPGLTIDADTNNDGAINASEKGSATTTSLTATFDKTKVAVGDTITFSDGKATKVVTLTQAMIDAGKAVSTDWALPADGNSLNVSASLKNAAGNTTPLATDSAKIDTTPPTNSHVGLSLSITTDANDDGWVNAAELSGKVSFTSHASFNANAVAGDKIVFTATNGGTALPELSHILTQQDISYGYVDVTFERPADGALQKVTANYMDAAGNLASDTSKAAADSATLDINTPTNASMALGVSIATDANADGWVGASELNGASGLVSHATFNSSAVAGDKIVFSATNGGVALPSQTHTLTPQDINNGYVDVSFAKPDEGASQQVTATCVDAAGNAAAAPAPFGSATLDTTATVITKSSQVATSNHLDSWNLTAKEGGHYTLNIGSKQFAAIPGADLLTGLAPVAAKDVWLDYWDNAGNLSARTYLYDNTSTTLMTIDSNTHFSMLVV